MFKRNIVRQSLSLCSRQPLSVPRPHLRFNSNQSGSGSGSNETKKPESWTRFIVVRAGAIAGGYIVGKVYYYYNPKHDDSFQSYDLVSRDPISSTLSIFTVKPKNNGQANNAEELRQVWKQGVWNLQFKQPQLQILRAYTPIPLSRAQDPDTNELQFLIRRDPRGEVSTYLHRLPPGTSIEMRGPNVEFPLSSDTTNVLFIAGGTGIAPALQVAHAMFTETNDSHEQASPSPSSPEKNLQILWANRSKEDISTNASPNPIISYLNTLIHSHDQSIKVTYFTDEDQTYITPEVLSTALSNKQGQLGNTGETQIIISGPEGFINYLAGPKIWKDGKEQQGPLGGVLARVLEEREKKSKGAEIGKVKVWKV